MGRRQRQAEARRRARRRRWQVRAWWTLIGLALGGLVVFLAVSGIGAG